MQNNNRQERRRYDDSQKRRLSIHSQRRFCPHAFPDRSMMLNDRADFYLRILGGKVIRSGEPTIIQIANSWIVLNVGGGPTDDKPTVTLQPPQNPKEVSNFMNIRVADIQGPYEDWGRKGAEFLTEPKDHALEIRCYMRDPDGYIIEVGQTTGGLKDIKA